MAELPDDVHELEDLLRATEGLWSEWRGVRRRIEDEVREFVGWLYDPFRVDMRNRRIGTFTGLNSPYSFEDYERSQKLSDPVNLYRLREIDDRLRPFLDEQELEKSGYELESFRNSAAEKCLHRRLHAVDEVSMIAERRDDMVKQLRDRIIGKRRVVREHIKSAGDLPKPLQTASVCENEILGSIIPENIENLEVHSAHPQDSIAGTTDARAKLNSRQHETEDLVLNDTLKGVLNALDGRAMRVEQLAKAVTGGEATRLYRDGMKSTLEAKGLIVHDGKIGWYRPDRPPADRVVTVVKSNAKK